MAQQYRVANTGKSVLYVKSGDSLRKVEPGRRAIVNARQRLDIQKTELFKMGLLRIEGATDQDTSVKKLLALDLVGLTTKLQEMDDTAFLEEILVAIYDKGMTEEFAQAVQARIAEIDVPDLTPEALPVAA